MNASNKVNTTRLTEHIRSLPLFDDIFLRMQAINLDLVDAYLLYDHNYKPAEKNATVYAARLQRAFDLTGDLFHRIEALRISLSKHETPTRDQQHAIAPGYGRLNEVDGSIFWQIRLRDNEIDQLSRREISDMCRDILKRRKRVFIPRSLRERVRNLPKMSYAYRRIAITVRGGSVFPSVLVRWGFEVLSAEGHAEIPFKFERHRRCCALDFPEQRRPTSKI